MRITKRIVNETHIENLFRNLARQKNVPVTASYRGHVFDAELLFAEKRGILPELHVSSSAIKLEPGKSVEIRFSNKGVFFLCEMALTAATGDTYRLNFPSEVHSQFRRLYSRISVADKGAAIVTAFHGVKPLYISDISAGGVLFRTLAGVFSTGAKLKDVRLTLGYTEVYVDLEIRHTRHDNRGRHLYGAKFRNLNLKTYAALFSWVLSRTYPDVFTLESIDLECDEKLCGDRVAAQRQLASNPALAAGFASYRNGRVQALGTLARIHESTFMGHHLLELQTLGADPKSVNRLHLAQADYLLNHPYFAYYTSYISEDLSWHKHIFTDMERIIGDSGIFHFTVLQHFEYAITTLEDPVFITAALCVEDESQKGFKEFAAAELPPLESGVCGYSAETLNQPVLEQVFAALGYTTERRVWRIEKEGSVLGYVLAEAYPDEVEAVNLANCCRVFPLQYGADFQDVLEAALPQVVRFFRKNGKRKFHILFRAWTPVASTLVIDSLTYVSEVGWVMMNRKGLAEYKKLMLDNFVQYRKYYPLTHPQRAIWQTERYLPGTCFGNICSSIQISVPINGEHMEAAIRRAVEKNDGLRLHVEGSALEPRQYVVPYRHCRVTRVDFRENGGSAECDRWIAKQNEKPFTINGSQLYDFALLRISDTESRVYVKTHHIISDGWAVVWLCNKIMAYYSALNRGGRIARKRKPSYLEYVSSEQAYMTSNQALKHQGYWLEKFATTPEFTALKPHQGPIRNMSSRRLTMDMDIALSENVNKLCGALGISPVLVFLAAFYLYVYRVTGKTDIVLGTPILNRSSSREKEMFGMFVSMVPVRISLDPEASAIELLEGIGREWKSVLRNQKYPYDRIIQDYRETHGVKELLFDTVISYQNASVSAEDASEKYQILWHHNGCQTETLSVHISDRNQTGSYELAFDFLPERFSLEETQQLAVHVVSLLKELTNNSHKAIGDLKMLSDQELYLVTSGFNQTRVAYPSDLTVVDLFRRHVANGPMNSAIVDGPHTYTYTELDELSERIAGFLQEQGITRGAAVGVLMMPSAHMIAAILGVLKSGGAYVPADLDYPADRVRYMMQDSGAQLVLSEDLNQASRLNMPVFSVSDIVSQGKNRHIKNMGITPSDPAYIIYTSGSTGKPKGVVIGHQALLNLCCWHNRRFEVTDQDRASKYAGVGFDASVWEMFPYLVAGAPIYIIPNSLRYDLAGLNRFFNENKISISFLPTQVCERFMAFDNHSLRYLLTGADKLSRFEQRNYTLVNNYGPTESAVVTTSFDVDRHYGNIPIGKPIDNIRLYILDKRMHPQPVGVVGEIYIAGDGLASGYVGNPSMTAERFVNGSSVGEERLYRTGDLACWRPDGNVEFWGRCDNQIKIRGYRIEIGEIESCMLEVEGIHQAVVVVREEGALQQRLVGYYTAEQPLNNQEIRGHMVSRLPEYMVPQQLIWIAEVPLTANGKLDRSRLPSVNTDAEEPIMKQLPETDAEHQLITAAEQILAGVTIGVNDNLIELGFDSLMLIQLMVELEASGLKCAIQDFYDCRTLKEVACRMQGHGAEVWSPVEEMERRAAALPDIACVAEARRIDEQVIKDGENLLLTGATGYLGIHLLHTLLNRCQENIYCLVRGESDEQAELRLSRAYGRYFPGLDLADYKQRLTVLAGDVALPMLGLTEETYYNLGAAIGTVYNPAANVRHCGSTEVFQRVNVQGVANLLEFCAGSRARLNHISTVSVSGNYTLQATERLLFTEADLSIGQDVTDNPYVHSKYTAEIMVSEAMARGVACSVFRVGNLSGRYSDGVFQSNIEDNRFYNTLRTFMMCGMMPESMLAQSTDMTPVDICSQSIVELGRQADAKGRFYHVFNPKTITLCELTNQLSSWGYTVEAIPDQLFMRRLNQYCRDTKDFQHLKGFLELAGTSAPVRGGGMIQVSAEITENALMAWGIRWPEVDHAYVGRLLNHIRDVGFIKSIQTEKERSS